MKNMTCAQTPATLGCLGDTLDWSYFLSTCDTSLIAPLEAEVVMAA